MTPERTFAVTGALGAGKTTGAAYFVIDRWLLNRKSQFTWCVAPTATRCEQIIIPALKQVLFDVYGMTDGVQYRIYRGKFYKLILKNYQHEIHILSGDNPDGFVGANISCFWVTEPGLMERTVYEKLMARLRCPKAVIRQALLEGSPEGMSGKGAWWADIGDLPGVGYDRIDADKNIRRIILETRMNRWLQPSPEVYLQKLQQVYGHDPARLKSYTLGLFVPFTKSTAYWSYVASQHVDRTGAKPDPQLPVELTWDFNVSPLAWVAAQQFTYQRDYYSPRTKKLIALKESSGESRGLYDACLEFRVWFPVERFRNTPIRVYGDASGYARSHKIGHDDYTAIEEYLRGTLGYRNVEVLAERANPEVRVRLEKVNAALAYDMVAISPDCPRLLDGLVRTSLKDGTYQIEKPSGETHTHYPDALGYLIVALFGDQDITNPKARGSTRPLGGTL
jgi:hypothetical protein